MELQIPPVDIVIRLIIAVTHTLSLPEIVPATGNTSTDSVLTATAVPQELTTVYLIVSIPAEELTPKPETRPTMAIAVLTLVHTPPVLISENETGAPTHTLESPAITPAKGNGFIAIK